MNCKSFQIQALAFQKSWQVVDVLLQMFVHVNYIGNWLAALVNDDAGALLIWELFNALSRNYLNEFYLNK